MNSQIHAKICELTGPAKAAREKVGQNPNDLDVLIQVICDYTEVDKEMLLSPRRFKELIFARMLFCQIAHLDFGLSLNVIGVYLNRDHTTVMNSLRRFSELLDTNSENSLLNYKKCLSLTKVALKM